MSSRLDDLDLSRRVKTKSDYERQLKDLQLRLLNLEQALRYSRHSVLIAFEGWDASGKGGAIKRLTERLDPRGYKVYGIAAPTEEEKRRHYLWRFWTRTPARGEMVIFDRSWYGRVLVERVEGFATREQWRRAYEEINAFERQLVSDDTLVLKFWMHISEEEQLRRFEERANSPFKSWKITPDDWRNRSKRKEYEKAAEEMFRETDTKECPWHLIPANDKCFGRLQVIERVVQVMERALGKQDMLSSDQPVRSERPVTEAASE